MNLIMRVIIPSLFTFEDSQGAKALLSPGEKGGHKYTINFSKNRGILIHMSQ